MNKRYLEIKKYVEKHDKIADLGIGKGYYYHDSIVNKKNVVGIDLNGSNLRKLASHSPEIKTYLRDVRESGLPNKTYDLVVISQVLEHLKDYEPVIKEAKRICKDDGYFLIGVPINAFHKLHFHPIWQEIDVRSLAYKFGDILELIEHKDHYWTIYIKNDGKL